MAGGVKLQEQSDSKAHRLLYFQEPTLDARNLRPQNVFFWSTSIVESQITVFAPAFKKASSCELLHFPKFEGHFER
jgi:hypothetical protein